MQIKALSTTKVAWNMGLHLLKGIVCSLKNKQTLEVVNKAAILNTRSLNYWKYTKTGLRKRKSTLQDSLTPQ